ncbi:MAG: glycosyl transferase group 1 [Mucilaginibacter sp.]|nr:glycosyl transferase group 1 [Mucilaginibacter sp.]
MNSCKVCNKEVEQCFKALILKKYDVKYYRCTNCGLIQTESPYWLNEAYSNAITNQDIGLVSRNLVVAPILSCLLTFCFDKKQKFLDYGGGYGLLTRIMRDKGYNYFLFDTYCENVFAKGFDLTLPGIKPEYEILSSFEVFEHLVDPVSELEKMLKWSESIFFSTDLQPSKLDSADDWWYVIPETGQHITFYTYKSLRLLGEKYNLNFYSNGINLHLFTKKKINALLFKIITNYRIAKLLDLLPFKNRSLLTEDFEVSKKKEF